LAVGGTTWRSARLAEAVAFGEAMGLDRELTLDALDNSGWRSPGLAFRAGSMRNRSYRPAAFRAVLMHKDLRLASREAAGHGIDLLAVVVNAIAVALG